MPLQVDQDSAVIDPSLVSLSYTNDSSNTSEGATPNALGRVPPGQVLTMTPQPVIPTDVRTYFIINHAYQLF